MGFDFNLLKILNAALPDIMPELEKLGFLESKTELINEIYVTKIKKNYDCDTFFPNITNNNKFIIDRGWSGISSDLEFIIYKRK